MALFRNTNSIYLIATLAAIIFCGMVSSQNRSLAVSLDSMRSGQLAGPAAALPGDIVPSFELSDLHGRSYDVKYADIESGEETTQRYRLFFFYSNGCSACVEQKKIWRDLDRDFARQRDSLELISLLLAGEAAPKPSMDDSGSASPLVLSDRSIQRAYRVTSIPAMLLVSPNGRVLWAHYGVMSQGKRFELLDLVDRSLQMRKVSEAGPKRVDI